MLGEKAQNGSSFESQQVFGGANSDSQLEKLSCDLQVMVIIILFSSDLVVGSS